MFRRFLVIPLVLALIPAAAAIAEPTTVTVLDENDRPLQTAMVTLLPSDVALESGAVARQSIARTTKFSNREGVVHFAVSGTSNLSFRLRAPGYHDALFGPSMPGADIRVTMVKEDDLLALAAARPASNWVAALDFPNDTLKTQFLMQCTYCHQQGSLATRSSRDENAWNDTVRRMVGYGSLLSSDAQQTLPTVLADGYREILSHPESVQAAREWEQYLSNARITEWPIGDLMSNMHDLLLASTGLVYVGDDIKGQLIEFDLSTGNHQVHDLPRHESDERGGPLGFEITVFPDQSHVRLHSLAESKVDGHIFTTDSRQARIYEFDPADSSFVWHQIPEGMFPHTIRIDQDDRVWFTLALSNQVGMLSRDTNRFTIYDLPTSGPIESLQVTAMAAVIQLGEWGVPLHMFPIDSRATGIPLPYGIDIAPDGMAWFTRLHSNEIGRIDPTTGQITMFPVPFVGPRRLRIDADGKLWITAYGESKIARFDPMTRRFDLFDLPTEPKGSDTPYALNIDHRRNLIWVTGTGSDSLMSFDPESETWRVYPLPRRVSYTRELEIMVDGSVLTSTSNQPAWHEEGVRPTIIHLEPALRSTNSIGAKKMPLLRGADPN